MATISAREFNRDVSAAKRTAATEPVIITDRGTASHVLLSIEAYHRLVGDDRSIVDRLSVDDDLDLTPSRLQPSLQVPDL